ncbi:MAG: glycosyltransferase [Leucobacter sp.]
MQVPGFQDVRKAFEILLGPRNAWRRQLLVVRRGIDRLAEGEAPGPALNRWLDGLISTAAQTPQALLPTWRQLLRVDRAGDGLRLVDRVWNDGNASPEAALACAEIWYESGNVRMGDLAVDTAKRGRPDWLAIYELEAWNQRKRGNASVALEAAYRAVALSEDDAQRRGWNLFLGELEFERCDYAGAARLFRGGWPEAPSKDLRYRFAMALERSGAAGEAAEQYAAAAGRAAGAVTPAELAELHFRHENYAETVSVLDGHDGGAAAELLRLRSQMMLGDFGSVLGRVEAGSEDPALLELRALALELSDRREEAHACYTRLLGLGDLGRREVDIRRRAARAAYLAGDPAASVDAELGCPSHEPMLERMQDEVHPAYAELVSEVSRFLESADHEGAVPVLRRLAYSSSTRMNMRVAYRLLATSLAAVGDIAAAAESFYRANPFRLPHAEEAMSTCAGLSRAEFYSEAWEVLPLDADVVVYESFHGVSTACNPLAVCRELLDSAQHRHLQHVWVLVEGAVPHPELADRPNVHFVELDSWGYYVHLASAGYLVNNTTFPRRFVRREGQRYVNTWHGVPWKHMGRDVADNPFGFDNVARNLLQATHVALPDEHTRDVLVRTQDIDNLLRREPIVVGSPRVDRTLGMTPAEAETVRRALGIASTRPMVLYAPTWRGTQDSLKFSIEPYLEGLEAMARLDVEVVVRFHHFLAGLIDWSRLPANVHVAPKTVDTNELLGAADVLVSDYSSLIFDFAPLQRPILKYVFDLDDYLADRGLYFGVDAVPGEDCATAHELEEALARAVRPDRGPCDWSASPIAALWAHEDGRATSRVVAAMFGPLEPPAAPAGPGNVLIALSGLRLNGVTRSLRNLVATYQGGHRFQLFVPKVVLSTPQAMELAAELHERMSFSLYGGILTGTRQESIAWKRMQDLRSPFPGALERWIRSRMQRERLRYFSHAAFSGVIDFDGYRTHQAAILGLGFPDDVPSTYVAHNEFCRELEVRFPRLREVGALLHNFTTIASVSDSVMRRNRDDLEREFGVAPERHLTLTNTLDIEGFLRQAQAPLEEDLRAWYERPGVHLVVAARLSVEKNHEALLSALAELGETAAEVDLLLLGEGPREQALRAQARAAGIDDRVMFAGQRTNPYPAIARADGLMLPSLHEGQGLVLLEAMVLGTPVAATNIPGPASVLDGGRYGMLVEPDVEGIATALRAFAARSIPPSSFDVHEYQREAMRVFEGLCSARRREGVPG